MRIHVFALVLLAGCAAPPATEPPKGWTPGAPPELLALVPPDLRYVRVDIPPEQNAFTPWSRAVAAFTDVKGSQELEAAWDRLADNGPFPGGDDGRLLTGWLDRNREALALWVEGSRDARCQFPPMLEGLRSELPYLAPIRMMAEATSLRAKRSAATGDFESAANDLLATLRCGDLAVSGEGCLVCFVVGASIQQTALDGLRWLTTQPGVPRTVLEAIRARVVPDPRAAEGLTVAWRVELCCCDLPAIADPAGQIESCKENVSKQKEIPIEEQIREVFARAIVRADKRAAVALFSAFCRRFASLTASPWKSRDKAIERDVLAIQKDGEKAAEGSFDATGVAKQKVLIPGEKVLFSWICPAAEAITKTDRLNRARREAVRAIVAIRLFVDRRQRLPDSLDELVMEGILTAVPTDPFNDQPLRYSKERRVVWSVGADEVDDGGVVDPELSIDSKDYAWPVR